ncbi:flagellar export chaperone FlgN [Vibrio olivae]
MNSSKHVLRSSLSERSEQISSAISSSHNCLKLKPLYLQFNGEALDTNLRQVNPILDALGQSANTRTQCMKQLHLPANEQGANRLLHALPAPIKPGILKQWAKLQSLVKRCQQLNYENGQSSASFHELIKPIFQPEQHTYQEHNIW